MLIINSTIIQFFIIALKTFLVSNDFRTFFIWRGNFMKLKWATFPHIFSCFYKLVINQIKWFYVICHGTLEAWHFYINSLLLITLMTILQEQTRTIRPFYYYFLPVLNYQSMKLFQVHTLINSQNITYLLFKINDIISNQYNDQMIRTFYNYTW